MLYKLIIYLIKILMSIYSGFPTRKDQTKYNQLIARLLQLLQAHLLQALPNQKISNSKVVAYTRIITKMQQYEEHKYLPPKFSELLHPLSSLIGIPTKVDNFTSDNVLQAYPQKLKSLNFQRTVSNKEENKTKYLSNFKASTDSDRFVQTKNNYMKKQSRFSDNTPNRQYKLQQSFYSPHLPNEDEQQLKLRSQTQTAMKAHKNLANSRQDSNSIYNRVHLKAVRQAQNQLKLRTNGFRTHLLQ